MHTNTRVTFGGVVLLISVLLASCATTPQPTSQDAALALTPIPSPELTGRGVGGTLRLVYHQAPTLLNPHLSGNPKDTEAARITYEPLASFDAEGTLVPFLAAEIPSLENGGVAADGRSVTWHLREDVRWADGTPFTADDVVFTYEFITNPEVPAAYASVYASVANVEALDSHTVRVEFAEPTTVWSSVFVGVAGVILPRHHFADYNGANALEAPANEKPIGTGPYYVSTIKPQEVLFLSDELARTYKIVYEINPYFRNPDQPFFQRVELRGGGTAEVAALQVLNDGAADYAWNPLVQPDAVAELEASGLGQVLTSFEGRTHMLQFNLTDPDEGSVREHPHPILSDVTVRQALAHAIDRQTIVEEVYGALGQPADDYLLTPDYYQVPDTMYPFDLERAAELLDEAGWVDSDDDGIRDRDGERLTLDYQVPINVQYQAVQRIIAADLRSIGVDVRLQVRNPNVFFGDPSQTGSWAQFNADITGVGWFRESPDPAPHMGYWTCEGIPAPDNQWSGFNFSRWCNPAYDALLREAENELDEERRRELFRELNRIMQEDVPLIVLVQIARVAAASNSLEGIRLTPWDTDTWNIAEWRRERQTRTEDQVIAP